jgi:hypothetical protein
MARIRSIKPETWDDEKLSKISRDARLLFIGMWNFSDDFGVCRSGSVWLKSKIFPYDVLQLKVFESWLSELEQSGFIISFHADNGESYYHLPNFSRHQKIDKISKTLRNPEYKGSTNSKRIYSEQMPEEGKGEEGRGEEGLAKNLKIENCTLKKESIDYQVIEASIKLYKGFVLNFPDNRDLPLKTVEEWVPPVRTLIEKKKYTYDQIKEIIIWASQERFWKAVILDTQTLEKNFEKLKVQYKESYAKQS